MGQLKTYGKGLLMFIVFAAITKAVVVPAAKKFNVPLIQNL